jgi:hypothetical protein
MMNPIRIIVLTALTVFAVSSFPTGSLAAAHKRIACESAKDCPKGDICKHQAHHKLGVCVGVPKKTKS